MVRALITGFGGFVGPYLAAELVRAGVECFGTVRNDSERALVSPAVQAVTLDVRNRSAFAECVRTISPDYLIHLAAISDVESGRRQPAETFEINAGGTLNVLEAVRESSRSARVLIVSSGAVYGDRESGDAGFSEVVPPSPTNTYAVSKHVAEQIAACFVRDHGLDVIVARPFNHTGPGQSPVFVCSSLTRQVAESLGEEIVITTGALHPRRDFSDVRDVVAGYRVLLERGVRGEVYNICSGRTHSIAEIVELMARDKGEIEVRVDPAKLRVDEVQKLGGDPHKLRKLGWQPAIPLSQTLHEMIEYWAGKAKVAA